MGDMVADQPDERAADSTLVASRALLGVIARSMLGALQDVTLPQFRVLVILASSGPLRMGAIAAQMGSHPSSFSRTVDRLVAGGWVEREVNRQSRRETLIGLTDSGRNLVNRVTDVRRAEIREILGRLTAVQREDLDRAFATFAEAAGEPSPSDLLVLGY
ncbi:MarR family transcriptional regulator [Microbacterium sp. NPDC019599]|uniref:MarR family winged helix-turn-helix transcriptional regulator n=1 Tax=Microbacterium sp. NPDC019599 TaxID=3154690 RepID=UPI003401DC04